MPEKDFLDSLGVEDCIDVELVRHREIADAIPTYANVRVELRGPDGKLKALREIHNLVVTAGKTQIAKQMTSALGTAPTHMAVGTGNVAPAVGDTALGAEIATTGRQAVTSNTNAANVQTVVGDWAAGQATNAAITEAGIFNAAAAGTMTARATFTLINKGASDTLKITWTITYG